MYNCRPACIPKPFQKAAKLASRAWLQPPPPFTKKNNALTGGNPPRIRRGFYHNEFLLCAEIWQGEPDKGLLRTVSVHGETVSLDYDGLGRLVRRIREDTLNYSEARITRYEYPDPGQLIIDGPRDDINDVRHVFFDEGGNIVEFVNAAGHHFAMEYDGQGRLAVWTSPNGVRREYEYGDQGRVILERAAVGTRQETALELEYDAAGRLMASRRQGEGNVRRSYDEAGRLASVSDDAGARLQLRYGRNGTLQGVFASEGLAASRSGRGEGVLPSLPGRWPEARPQGPPDLHSQDEAVSYQRDVLGRVMSATFADGSVTGYEHSGFGEVIAEHHPSGVAARYEYDPVGNRVREIREGGGDIWRAFDALGRLTREDVQLTSALPLRVQYHYDSCANGIGRLCEVRSSAGATRYEYDALGNAIDVDAIAGGPGGPIQYRSGPGAESRLSGGWPPQGYGGADSGATSQAGTGATPVAQPGLSAAATAVPPSIASRGFENLMFYSGFNCSGYGHPGLHVSTQSTDVPFSPI